MQTFPSGAAHNNVRWDDVVDSTLIQSLVKPAILQKRDGDSRASDVRVHVQLFGALASITTERTLDIVVPKPTTVGAVVAALGERLGDAFLARVLDKAGTKQRYCRLFVAGVQIEDLRTPIDTDSIEIEMILLVAIEGG